MLLFVSTCVHCAGMTLNTSSLSAGKYHLLDSGPHIGRLNRGLSALEGWRLLSQRSDCYKVPCKHFPATEHPHLCAPGLEKKEHFIR